MTNGEIQHRKQETYFAEMCYFMKAKDELLPNTRNAELNRTELRLISEVISAQYVGERVISTQLAKRIGVTRSAVSQMVAKLEEQGILRRVASEKDKKIAYVEIADGAFEKYGDALEQTLQFLGDVVDTFGEEKFQALCSLFREFVKVVKKQAGQENK